MTRMNECSNCGGVVPARRPSKSGEHFCKDPSCQAAKVRFYRRSAEPANVDEDGVTNPCSNCGAPVRSRRPSQTGQHFCPRAECRKAANRFYRSRVTMTAGGRREVAIREHERLELLGAALRNIRTDCDVCGAQNVLGGWIHRDARDLYAPCTNLGNKGFTAGPEWVDAVWPELVP